VAFTLRAWRRETHAAVDPFTRHPVRDIAVHCTTFHDWSPGVRYAVQLATEAQARLTGLYIGDRKARAPGPPLLVEEMAAYAQDELQQAMLAGRAFAEWAARLGLDDARWQVAIGDAGAALAMAGDWNDLLVMELAGAPRQRATLLLAEALVAGAPCLAVPENCLAPGHVAHVAVAWNGTLASSRALHAALPLLKRARSVVLLQPPSVDGDGLAHRWPLARNAAQYLAAHGVPVVATEYVDGEGDVAAERLLAAALAYRADLLVMGASGGRRLGGHRFGRTTAGLLQRSPLPLLLRH
jgi:nucleotide-binding universal stress UspA family protein